LRRTCCRPRLHIRCRNLQRNRQSNTVHARTSFFLNNSVKKTLISIVSGTQSSEQVATVIVATACIAGEYGTDRLIVFARWRRYILCLTHGSFGPRHSASVAWVLVAVFATRGPQTAYKPIEGRRLARPYFVTVCPSRHIEQTFFPTVLTLRSLC